MLNHYLLILKWTVVIQQIRREREYYMLKGYDLSGGEHNSARIDRLVGRKFVFYLLELVYSKTCFFYRMYFPSKTIRKTCLSWSATKVATET